MTTTNEPKYKIENGKLVNRQSGEAIPEDEPIFILRGCDVFARTTLRRYLALIPWGDDESNEEHRRAVTLRLLQFENFAAENPERIKTPDTTITPDWPGSELNDESEARR